ncbi:MAG: hypothetical protein ACHQX3_00240 [Nitrospirales bacterium]
MKLEIKGISTMSSKLKDVQDLIPTRVAKALFIEGNIEMTEAKKRCPVDVDYSGGRKPPHPGQLRNSGTCHPPMMEGKKMFVILSFGGAAIDYAIYVHEIIGNYHPVGQAKYLESVLNESRPYMAERLGKRLKL